MSESVEQKAGRYLCERRIPVLSVSPYRVDATALGTKGTVYRFVREAGKGSSCTCPGFGRRGCHRLAWVGDVTERLLTAREAAGILGVATGTLLDWFEAGKVPAFKLGEGKAAPVRFRASELEAWLEGYRRGPLATPIPATDTASRVQRQ